MVSRRLRRITLQTECCCAVLGLVGKLSLQEIYEYMQTDEVVMATLKASAQRDFTDDEALMMTKDQFVGDKTN